MTDEKVTTAVARTPDLTIQITFTVPFALIKKEEEKALEELAKEVEIPGFRKGNAPLTQAKEKIDKGHLMERTLSKILPEALAKTLTEEKIRPAIYPKFEILKNKENEPWEIRATTCELPAVILGDYKKAIGGGIIKTAKEMSREEKEEKVIKVLLETQKITVPELLVREEVDARLSSLLSRIEKLGLNLEGYLSSVGKTPQGIRKEYEIQSKNTIHLELLLNAIAQEEKIEVKDSQVDEAIKAAAADPKLEERLNTPEQKRIVKSVLSRRAALDSLINLV